MPKKSFTDAYNDDPAYGDDLNGEEIIGLDPDAGVLSKGIKLLQLSAWLGNFFALIDHDHAYIPQVPTATTDNIAIWDTQGNVIDSGININQFKYKTIATFVENQLNDPSVELLRHPVVTPFAIEVDAVGSQYSNGTNPTASAVFTFEYNGVEFGSMTVDTGGNATFDVPVYQLCNTGGVLVIKAPSSADATIANIGINLRTLRL